MMAQMPVSEIHIITLRALESSCCTNMPLGGNSAAGGLVPIHQTCRYEMQTEQTNTDNQSRSRSSGRKTNQWLYHQQY